MAAPAMIMVRQDQKPFGGTVVFNEMPSTEMIRALSALGYNGRIRVVPPEEWLPAIDIRIDELLSRNIL